MPNIMKLMKQAASMQKNMERMQAEMAQQTFEFSSGGGMGRAIARGDGTVAAIKIDPKVIDPNDVEMLEDMVLAAVDGALTTAREAAAKEMSKLTAGLNIPGL